MRHTMSSEDRDFLDAFETCAVAPEAVDHAAHVRLAYIYLKKRGRIRFFLQLDLPPVKQMIDLTAHD